LRRVLTWASTTEINWLFGWHLRYYQGPTVYPTALARALPHEATAGELATLQAIGEITEQSGVRLSFSVPRSHVPEIVAALLKGPVADLLNFWQAFTPIVREFWIFIGLFVGLSVAGWFIVRAFYRTTRVPILKQLDEIGGALLGLLFAATFIVLQLVVMDSLFRPAPQLPGSEVGGLRGYYVAMNDSILVGFFRDTIIPTAGFVIRPFVPSDIAAILRLK